MQHSTLEIVAMADQFIPSEPDYRPEMTDAQAESLTKLVGDGVMWEVLQQRCTWDLLCWKPGNPATLFVNLHGMLIGIEPDGYTHS